MRCNTPLQWQLARLKTVTDEQKVAKRCRWLTGSKTNKSSSKLRLPRVDWLATKNCESWEVGPKSDRQAGRRVVRLRVSVPTY